MLNTELPVAQLKAEIFKALGHPLRIRVLELLVAGEHSVGALADALDSEIAAVSQQLGVLRRAGVVITRREGSTVHYSLRDPGMIELLAVARAMIVAGLSDSRELLAGLEAELEEPAESRP